jgi:hypothetical protein
MCGFAIETTRREIGLDHLRLRRHVPTLDPLREAHLLVGRQQRHPADLTQVEPERVERRLDGQVEHRRRSRAALRNRRLLVRRLLVLLPLDQLDRAIEQVGVEVLDLLGLQHDVLKHGGDLVVGQKPLLDPIRDESLQRLDVGTIVPRPRLRQSRAPCASSGIIDTPTATPLLFCTPRQPHRQAPGARPEPHRENPLRSKSSRSPSRSRR